MNFKNILNQYIKDLNCTAKELSEESGLSQTVISRYRNGERIPSIESKQLNLLIKAICKISNNKLSEESILETFKNAIENNDFDYESFSKKFNELISTMNLSIIEMSRYIKFDPSYISRIRNCQRKPAYPNEFVEKVCNYVVNKYNDSTSIKNISYLLNCNELLLNSPSDYYNTLHNWLTKTTITKKNYISDFFKNLDEFNLNDYIKAIKFDELKVPNIPFYRKKPKNYYGLEEMKQGELDFFKVTVLSKNKDAIFMCSDMPMEDMANDVDFGKKWMFAIAMSLKKGLHLNIIHNLDRPFEEMMLGLESWIPIYMTGQVSPYYLKDTKESNYCHLNYVSGSIALTGECIKGFHDMGKYFLTNNKKELDYYKEKAKLLLKRANPLMTIYREENKNEFNDFLDIFNKIENDRHRILSTLPLFTIEDDLLISILKRNNICNNDINNILKYKNDELDQIKNILTKNIINDEINNSFDDKFLSLENMFYNKKILYTEEEYTKHLKQTKEFEEKNSNYKITTNKNIIFHNIEISIINKQCVIISKCANPTIHFIIKHPKLIDSITNFKAPIKE